MVEYLITMHKILGFHKFGMVVHPVIAAHRRWEDYKFRVIFDHIESLRPALTTWPSGKKEKEEDKKEEEGQREGQRTGFSVLGRSK